MRPLLFTLLLSPAALAQWPTWEATCSAGQAGCFAELASRSKDCKVMRQRTAQTVRGRTSVEWRRCPISGFRSVNGADLVVVAGAEGPLWAYSNLVDPSSSSVHDVVFAGRKLIWIKAAHEDTGGANFCVLSLAADPPRCIGPSPQELEEREQGFLLQGETLQGTLWSLLEVQPSRVHAERVVFAAGRRSGRLRMALKVRDDRLAIDELTRK